MNRPVDRSPVETLALARLLAAGEKGEAEKALGKALVPLVEHRWRGRDWDDRLGLALDGLREAGAVREVKAGRATRLALTDEGRRVAAEALGLGDPAARPTWAKLKAAHLPALALGRPGPAAINMKAEILRAEYRLDLGEKPRPQDAAGAVASKLMGLEPGRKFTADEILRKLLGDAGIAIPAGQKPTPANIQQALFRRELGDPSAGKPLDLLATRSVGARRDTAAELASAVLRSWVDRSEPSPVEETQAPAPPAIGAGPPGPIDLPDFARRVVEAARRSPTGWFGDAKVFISHVRRGLGDDPAIGGMDDGAFKGLLIEAHRARHLELGRADLVEAMDPVDVRESATPHQNAVYHFVRTEEPAR